MLSKLWVQAVGKLWNYKVRSTCQKKKQRLVITMAWDKLNMLISIVKIIKHHIHIFSSFVDFYIFFTNKWTKISALK